MSVQNSYLNGACPDCGDKIPKEAQDGENCPNCGHIWWLEDVDEQRNDAFSKSLLTD